MITHKQADQINAYSQNLSLRICREIFADRTSVQGESLPSLTPVPQINYFVLKVLYRSWQKEMIHIESPYFNYEQPEVRQALHDFMNTLSRHIEIQEIALQPLLRQACSDTLYLILSPEDFFRRELVTSVSTLSATYLRNTKKYLRINAHILEAFTALFEAEELEEITPTRSADLLEFCAQDLRRSEDTKPYLAALAELLPLPEDLYQPSMFVSHPSQDVPATSDSKTDEDSESNSEEEVRADLETDFETPLIDTSSVMPPEASPDISASGSSHEAESPSRSSLLKKSLDTPQTTSQSASLPKKPFRMIKDEAEDVMKGLFGNKVDLYKQAIKEIPNYDTFDEAIEMLLHRYGKPQSWNLGSREAKTFFRAIYIYFR